MPIQSKSKCLCNLKSIQSKYLYNLKSIQSKYLYNLNVYTI